ncbi:MAG: tetratricopeptide repeat protein [Methanomassiliicoccales archaeon]|nr:MAG: tetratricopeptide repeat protein [Methanomassiliicoccales archaeon]
MLEFDLQSEMVDRKEDMEELQAYLDRAAGGQGSTVLLSGEAGIGKTRLVNELKRDARSKGFQVLSGYSLHESYTPYMPFLDALRSGDLESLFSEEAPRVEAVYLVTDSGLLVKEVLREETKLDADIFASMLSTVGDFVKESLSMLSGEEKEGALNRLGYENYQILIESGPDTNLAVIITGKENEFLIEDMREILLKASMEYGSVLKDWDGDEEKVEGIEEFLQPLIASGKYNGVYYGKEDPKARRNLLFENVSLGLMRQSQTTPTLLCLEDLQWADPSSLALMHYVARNTRKCKLLVLGTYRPEDVTAREGKSHPLVETMQLMSREELYEHVELQRLPKESVHEFLFALFGDVDFDDDFIDRMYKETEGNPLYILELAKLMVDEGVIQPHDDVWKLSKDLEDVDIPSKIHDVILRRLDRVEKEERKVLDYASVTGEMFTSLVLASALDMKRVHLLERLKVLEKSHKLVHPNKGGYKFDHAKVREVLYNEIPTELRTEYHTIIAETIEDLNKDNLEEVIGDLAFQYYHCRNKEKARIYLVRAAEKAKRLYSNEEAIRFFTEALEFEEDSQKRMDIFESLGAVYDLVGYYDKSLETYNSALELAEEKKKRAKIKSNIGEVYEIMGDHDNSIKLYSEALDLVKEGECIEKGLALSGIGIVCWDKGEYDEALEHYEKSLEIMSMMGDEEGVARSLNNMGNVYLHRGEYDKALEQFHKSLGIAEKSGDLGLIARFLGNIGALHHHKGEYDKALQHYKKSLGILEKIGDQQGIAYLLNNIGVIYEDRGEYDRALQHYKKSLGILEKIGDQQVVIASLHNIGLVHKYVEDYDGALEYYEKSLEMSRRIGHQIGMAYNYCGIAEIHFKKKDIKKAKKYCNLAYEISKEIGVQEYVADSMRILGMIHREQEKWEESAENFTECVKICKEIGKEKELGESHFEFGLMWREKGDADNARRNLEQAVEIFEKLKLDKELDSAREALAELEVSPEAGF